MASSVLIDSHFQHYKTLIDAIFKELHSLTVDLQNEKLAVTVDDIRSRLNEPFLFVIVGEVKVGKSSFCLLYTSPSPRDMWTSRMPSSA